MKKHKKIGYEVGNVYWHLLKGHKELWNKADFDTKEKIVNETGFQAINLVKNMIVGELPSDKELNDESYIMGADNAAGREGFIKGVEYIIKKLKKIDGQQEAD